MIRRLTICLLALIPSLPAVAEIPPNPAARRVTAAINRLDGDGKGFVSRDDFLRGRAFAGGLFSALDGNADGVVDAREFGARRNARRAAAFRRLDRRQCGRLTFSAFRRAWDGRLFDALADPRGRLTAADLRLGMAGMRERGEPPPPPPPPLTLRPPANPGWPPLIGRPDRWALFLPWGP